jgi:hypothetical protein
MRKIIYEDFAKVDEFFHTHSTTSPATSNFDGVTTSVVVHEDVDGNDDD